MLSDYETNEKLKDILSISLLEIDMETQKAEKLHIKAVKVINKYYTRCAQKKLKLGATF